MMKLITGAMSYTVDEVQGNDSSGQGNSNSTTISEEMTAGPAAQLGQTGLQLWQKNLNIKPTLEIRPGYQLNLVEAKDVAFGGLMKEAN
jgi:type IV secretion system protein VirB10